jgi:hypothetical protein
LSQALASSPKVGYCAVATLYRYAYQRRSIANDWCKLDRVYETFRASNGNLRETLLAIATSDEFRNMPSATSVPK